LCRSTSSSSWRTIAKSAFSTAVLKRTHKLGLGRMSALRVNRTHRYDGTDVNDPTRSGVW
jgi:hypothetical protein